MKRIAFALCLFIASPALAQQPPTSTEQAISNIGQQWQAYQTQQANVMQALNALISQVTTLQSENKALKAENESLKKPADAKKPVDKAPEKK